MCTSTKCRTCGKTTWTGCGQHIDTVKANVPAADWCDGNHEKSQPSFFGKLLGRR